MSFMSDHLIVQQDDPEFPLDPELLIHAMWKELFDLEILNFDIWPFEYRCPVMMFPYSIGDYEFVNPDSTDLYDHVTQGLTIGVPAWVERFKYTEADVMEALDNSLEDVLLEEAFTWPWVLWSLYEAGWKGEINFAPGTDAIDILDDQDYQDELSQTSNNGITQHIFAKPIAQPGPAFEGFTYSGKEAEEALPVIQSLLSLEAPGSIPEDNAYCHALMLFAVHPQSTPASLELIAQSSSAAREFLKFNPSATPEILAKIK